MVYFKDPQLLSRIKGISPIRDYTTQWLRSMFWFDVSTEDSGQFCPGPIKLRNGMFAKEAPLFSTLVPWLFNKQLKTEAKIPEKNM